MFARDWQKMNLFTGRKAGGVNEEAINKFKPTYINWRWFTYQFQVYSSQLIPFSLFSPCKSKIVTAKDNVILSKSSE